MKNGSCTHRKLENHLTSCAVLFLLNLISGKKVLSTDDEGYLTKKNMSFALRRCIGVSVLECAVVKEENLNFNIAIRNHKTHAWLGPCAIHTYRKWETAHPTPHYKSLRIPGMT